MRFAAITPSISAFRLIRPRPSATGSISFSVWATAGSRQSITSSSRPPRPRSQGTGSSTWITVPTTIAPAYT